MSNIKQTGDAIKEKLRISENIRKKLSLTDFKLREKAQKDSITAKHLDSKPALQKDSITAKHLDSKPASVKKKVTIYLDKESIKILNLICAKKLIEEQKSDKSALVCEAIKSFYESNHKQ